MKNNERLHKKTPSFFQEKIKKGLTSNDINLSSSKLYNDDYLVQKSIIISEINTPRISFGKPENSLIGFKDNINKIPNETFDINKSLLENKKNFSGLNFSLKENNTNEIKKPLLAFDITDTNKNLIEKKNNIFSLGNKIFFEKTSSQNKQKENSSENSDEEISINKKNVSDFDISNNKKSAFKNIITFENEELFTEEKNQNNNNLKFKKKVSFFSLSKKVFLFFFAVLFSSLHLIYFRKISEKIFNKEILFLKENQKNENFKETEIGKIFSIKSFIAYLNIFTWRLQIISIIFLCFYFISRIFLKRKKIKNFSEEKNKQEKEIKYEIDLKRFSPKKNIIKSEEKVHFINIGFGKIFTIENLQNVSLFMLSNFLLLYSINFIQISLALAINYTALLFKFVYDFHLNFKHKTNKFVRLIVLFLLTTGVVLVLTNSFLLHKNKNGVNLNDNSISDSSLINKSDIINNNSFINSTNLEKDINNTNGDIKNISININMENMQNKNISYEENDKINNTKETNNNNTDIAKDNNKNKTENSNNNLKNNTTQIEETFIFPFNFNSTNKTLNSFLINIFGALLSLSSALIYILQCKNIYQNYLEKFSSLEFIFILNLNSAILTTAINFTINSYFNNPFICIFWITNPFNSLNSEIALLGFLAFLNIFFIFFTSVYLNGIFLKLIKIFEIILCDLLANQIFSIYDYDNNFNYYLGILNFVLVIFILEFSEFFTKKKNQNKYEF